MLLPVLPQCNVQVSRNPLSNQAGWTPCGRSNSAVVLSLMDQPIEVYAYDTKRKICPCPGCMHPCCMTSGYKHIRYLPLSSSMTKRLRFLPRTSLEIMAEYAFNGVRNLMYVLHMLVEREPTAPPPVSVQLT